MHQWHRKFLVALRVVPELEILTILPDRTSKSIIVNVQPHPVQRPFWQASFFHLPPKFTSMVKQYGNGNGHGVRELYLCIVYSKLEIWESNTLNLGYKCTLWYSVPWADTKAPGLVCSSPPVKGCCCGAVVSELPVLLWFQICIYFIFGKRTNIIYTRLLYLRVFDPSL